MLRGFRTIALLVLITLGIGCTVGPAWQNQAGGAGWRLLGTFQGPENERDAVRVATTDIEWTDLWSVLGDDAMAPLLDDEIAVSFAYSRLIGCEELRLDGVVIDHAAHRVYSVATDPVLFRPTECTIAYAFPVVFIVALNRDALPPGPFAVMLSEKGESSVAVDLHP